MNKWITDKIYIGEDSRTLENIWVFVIVFFLVLFLSQALFVFMVGSINSGLPWLLLVSWSVLAAYYLLFGHNNIIFRHAQEKIKSFMNKDSSQKERIDIARVPEVEKLVSKPRDRKEHRVQFNVLEKKLEQTAHDMGALVSAEGIKHIMSFGGGAENVLEDVIEKGRNIYPRFDGWVVLNKLQVASLLSHSKEPRVPFSLNLVEPDKEDEANLHEDAVSEELAQPPEGDEIVESGIIKDTYKTKNTKAPVNLPTGALQSKEATATATFLGLLCDGDEIALFTFMRRMQQSRENSIQNFITNTILMLDRVHEHRVDGVGFVDQYVLEKSRCFSNGEIEDIIAILVRSIDHRYKLPEIGHKLALVRTVEYIKNHKKD